MRESILITGASGFLGRHLIQAALDCNLNVYAAIRKSSNVEHFKQMSLTQTYLNYEDVDSLKKELELKQYSYIIHAAGLTKARTNDEYNLVNAQYTRNLAKAAEVAKGNLKKFIFISSLSAVGPLEHANQTINELTPPNPVTSYGKSKLKAEEALSNINIPGLILRSTAIYGPGDRELFMVFKMIAKGFEVYIGRKEQHLSFVYAKDLATIAVQSLFSKNSGVYNISDGNNYSRYEFAKYIKSELQKKTTKIYLPLSITKSFAAAFEVTNKLLNRVSIINKDKINELAAANWVCDITKAQEELKFNPEYSLEKGLKESINWYKKAKWL
jgi:nucleoside-diphosphate-sugar epimerase